MKMNYVAVEPGVPIAFHLSGPASDTALLICHGLGGYHIMWEDDAAFFARDRQVLVIDMRGHGFSPDVRNGTVADYTLEKLARDVIGVIEHCGLKQVDFLGNSLGGVVGLEVIKQRRDLVRSLLTCGTTFELHLTVAFVWLKKLVYRIKGRKLADYIAQKGTSYDAPRPLIREMYRNVSLPVTHFIDYNIYDYGYLDVAAEFDGPIFILRGELDSAINKALTSTLARLQGQADFNVVDLPGVGHFTNLDNPELFRREVGKALMVIDNRFAQSAVAKVAE